MLLDPLLLSTMMSMLREIFCKPLLVDTLCFICYLAAVTMSSWVCYDVQRVTRLFGIHTIPDYNILLKST